MAAGPEGGWATDAVTSATDRLINDADGLTYKLQGPINSIDMYKYHTEETVQILLRHFKDGFPADWKDKAAACADPRHD